MIRRQVDGKNYRVGLVKEVKMGIIANYKYLSDKNLKELKAFYSEEDKTFGETDDQNEDVEILLDLDKMWDALHFFLTGVGSSEDVYKRQVHVSNSSLYRKYDFCKLTNIFASINKVLFLLFI